MSPIVYLNVGGCSFTTRRDTLHAGFFLGLAQTSSGMEEIFVDRDPAHFRYILNWLRGSRCLPEDDQTLTELMWEADFYALDDMVASIRETKHRYSMLKTLDGIAASVRR